jgi:hypothetical protein
MTLSAHAYRALVLDAVNPRREGSAGVELRTRVRGEDRAVDVEGDGTITVDGHWHTSLALFLLLAPSLGKFDLCVASAEHASGTAAPRSLSSACGEARSAARAVQVYSKSRQCEHLVTRSRRGHREGLAILFKEVSSDAALGEVGVADAPLHKV